MMSFNSGSGGYDFGEIDWQEFWKVVKGNGPMNKDRIAARKKAWEEGAWVREAALAYAKKQSESNTISASSDNTSAKAF